MSAIHMVRKDSIWIILFVTKTTERLIWILTSFKYVKAVGFVFNNFVYETQDVPTLDSEERYNPKWILFYFFLFEKNLKSASVRGLGLNLNQKDVPATLLLLLDQRPRKSRDSAVQ